METKTKEIWKDITGYEGIYKVSNLGRVKSLERKVCNSRGYYTIKEKILKPGKDKDGYLRIYLYKDGIDKNMKIHRLVAQAFVKNNSLFNNEINHIDENKENNCATNLEWCDRKYNNNFGTHIQRVAKAKTGVYNTKKSKPVKCIETGKVYPSIMEVQRQLGFKQQHICSCCKGRIKTAYKFHWKYVD